METSTLVRKGYGSDVSCPLELHMTLRRDCGILTLGLYVSGGGALRLSPKKDLAQLGDHQIILTRTAVAVHAAGVPRRVDFNVGTESVVETVKGLHRCRGLQKSVTELMAPEARNGLFVPGANGTPQTRLYSPECAEVFCAYSTMRTWVQ